MSSASSRICTMLCLAGLGLLLIVHLLLALSWLKEDRQPLRWDRAEHAGKVIKVQHFLYRTTPPARGRLFPDDLRNWVLEHPFAAKIIALPLAGPANLLEAHFMGASRPPLAYLPSGIALGPWDASPDAIALAHGTLWFLALICATYLLGFELYGAWGALLSALVVSGYPAFLLEAHVPMVDIPLATMASLGVYALLRARGFRDLRGSLLVGATLGTGTLIKQPFFVVLILPVLWQLAEIGRRWRVSASSSRLRLSYAAHALLASLLVAGPWYVVNMPSTLRFIVESARAGSVEGDPTSLSVAGLLFYPRALVESSLGPWLTALALLGLVALLLPSARRERIHLGLAILGVAVTFGLLHPNKDPRYIAPALPLLAVASARLPVCLEPKPVRTMVSVALALLVAFTVLSTSHGYLSSPFRTEERLADSLALFATRSQRARMPHQEDWKLDRVLGAIARHRAADESKKKDTNQVSLFVLAEEERFAHGLSLLGVRNRLRARDGLRIPTVRVQSGIESADEKTAFYLFAVWRESDTGERPPLPEPYRDRLQPLLELDRLPQGLRASLQFHPAEGSAP